MVISGISWYNSYINEFVCRDIIIPLYQLFLQLIYTAREEFLRAGKCKTAVQERRRIL